MSKKTKRRLMIGTFLIVFTGAASAYPIYHFATKEKRPQELNREFLYFDELKNAEDKVLLFTTPDEVKKYVTSNWKSTSIISTKDAYKVVHNEKNKYFDTREDALKHIFDRELIETISVSDDVIFDSDGVATSWTEDSETDIKECYKFDSIESSIFDTEENARKYYQKLHEGELAEDAVIVYAPNPAVFKGVFSNENIANLITDIVSSASVIKEIDIDADTFVPIPVD